jgi:phosphoglycerate dehydrogenase-like enzyme
LFAGSDGGQVSAGLEPRLEPDSGVKVLITGPGLIGFTIARRLVALGAEVLLVDSMIPEYGGNLSNITDFRDRVLVDILISHLTLSCPFYGVTPD